MKILRRLLLLCLSLCLKCIASDGSHVLYSAFLQNRLTLQQPRPSATTSLDNNHPTGIRDRKCLRDRSRYLLKLRGGELAPAYFNIGVSTIILAETVVWLKIWTELAKRELLPSTLTRKIIHSASAPLFILHWPLFARDPSGRIVAALIPLLQIFRLLYAGLFSSPKTSASDGNPSHAGNELVAAVSRTGNRREALGGPLIYSVVLFLGTLLFFRESPVAIVAISQMAAGDGLADIMGRKFGRVKWPFSRTKSIVGTLSFFVGGFLCSFLGLWWMKYTGFLNIDLTSALFPTLLISAVSAIIELFPIVDDNISVPLIAALLSYLWLVPL